MKVLFVPSNKAHVTTFLAIAEKLKQRNHAALFLHRDSLIRPEYQVAAHIDASRYQVKEYDQFYESDLRRLLPSLASYRRFKREFGEFLRQIEFDVMVLSNDDSTMFERLAIELAHQHGEVSMLVQESVRPSNRPLSPLVQIRECGINGFARDTMKHFARNLKCGSFFRKGYGYGNCSRIAVAGDAFRRQLIAGGVESERISVTGQPRLDIHSGPPPALRHPEWDQEAPATLLFCNQPLPCRQETQDGLFVELSKACSSLSKVRLIFKLHPRDLPPAHWLSLLPPQYQTDQISVERERPLQEILPVADALMTIASTTALEGMVAGLPIGLVNYLPTKWYLPYDQSGAAVSVNHPGELGESVKALLYDRSIREACVANAESVLYSELYLRDGQSAERIVDTLEDMAMQQSRAAD